jgi:hypothetical protein
MEFTTDSVVVCRYICERLLNTSLLGSTIYRLKQTIKILPEIRNMIEEHVYSDIRLGALISEWNVVVYVADLIHTLDNMILDECRYISSQQHLLFSQYHIAEYEDLMKLDHDTQFTLSIVVENMEASKKCISEIENIFIGLTSIYSHLKSSTAVESDYIMKLLEYIRHVKYNIKLPEYRKHSL